MKFWSQWPKKNSITRWQHPTWSKVSKNSSKEQSIFQTWGFQWLCIWELSKTVTVQKILVVNSGECTITWYFKAQNNRRPLTKYSEKTSSWYWKKEWDQTATTKLKCLPRVVQDSGGNFWDKTLLTHGTTIQLHLSAIKQSNHSNIDCIWERRQTVAATESSLFNKTGVLEQRAARKISKSLQARGTRLNHFFWHRRTTGLSRRQITVPFWEFLSMCRLHNATARIALKHSIAKKLHHKTSLNLLTKTPSFMTIHLMKFFG